METTIKQMDQTERIKRFGIECIGPGGIDGVFFRAGTWRPGGEYIQKLIIRNVGTTVKKLKYKLPSSRYFSLAYPEPIVLSPGMFKEIDIVFRPVEYEPYDDAMYIKMLDGIADNGFYVPVRATIDKLILTAPEGLDMGYITTHQTSTLTFQLRNEGEVDAPFEWDVPIPFVFTPSSGMIPVGEYLDIIVTIVPLDASVFVSKAICHVGKGVHAIIPDPLVTTKLSAIAKFAYITLSEDSVNFSEVVSATKPERKELLLQNNSVVPAEFSLIRYDSDRDEVFDIYPKEGIVPPLSEITVTIDFNARAMGCFSLDRYAFRTPGNCTTMLTCKGMSMPPKVVLYKEPVTQKSHDASAEMSMVKSVTGNFFSEAAPEFSLNFRDVEVGKVESRLLYISNMSSRDVNYSIAADDQGIFKMSPRQGRIPALTKQFPIKVVFSPPEPINFYRRFFVLVGDAMPLFYDCIGSGHIRAKGEVKEQRPAPLRHAHIQAFRNRTVAGIGNLSPDQQDRMYAELDDYSNNKAFLFAHAGRIGTRAMSVAAIARPGTRTGETSRNMVGPAHEFFIRDSDKTCRAITINRPFLDFDYTVARTQSAPRTLVMYNTANAKVAVQWAVPFFKGADTTILKSRDNTEKGMITLDGQARKLEQLRAFSVDPAYTEIAPGQSATFNVTFNPKQSSRNFLSELEAYCYFKNQRTFRLVNDFSLQPPWYVTLPVMGHTFSNGQLLAKASMCGGNIHGGRLVFPCCYEGESIYQTFMIRNTSNLPCTFRMVLGWDDGSGVGGTGVDETFTVKPEVGEIDAEDFVLVCARFSPKMSKKYTQLVRLFINSNEGSKMILEGAGAIPYLILPDMRPRLQEANEDLLGLTLHSSHVPRGPQGNFNIKPTCIGLVTTRTFELKNASRLPLKFRVNLQTTSDTTEEILSITPPFGLLKGNESTLITVRFAPHESKTYSAKMNISVYPIGGKADRVIDANQVGKVVAPELLQQMMVNIVAPGDVGAIIFDPARTTADVRLVNTTEEHDIYLENVSDSSLKYTLMYKEEFIADESAEVQTKMTQSDVMLLKPMKDMVAAADSDSMASSFTHSLFCEAPTGLLPARSKTRVIFTYKPIKAGLFEFLIYAKISALDGKSGQEVLISNEESITKRIINRQESVAESKSLYGPPGDGGDGGDGDMFSVASGGDIHHHHHEEEEDPMASVAFMPLMSSITARAAFPKLLFEDIRTDVDIQISNIEYLWKRFNFAQVNYDLSVPMTAEEVALNSESSPDMAKFQRYKWEFAPAVINSPLQSIVIQISNNGYLTSSFHMHLPNEQTMDLEPWCDEKEPSEELNQIVCIIEELKLFTIEPMSAVLQPGEKCLVKISYQHSSLKYDGKHVLPVQVVLDQGKQFFLDFTGRTLPQPPSANPSVVEVRNKSRADTRNASGNTLVSPAGSAAGPPGSQMTKRMSTAATAMAASIANMQDVLLVMCTTTEGIIELAPVPVGLKTQQAPLQRTELLNVSGSNVAYEVDEQGMRKLIGDNYNLPIIRLANPSGTVPAGGSVFLEWYFYPLEGKTYEFPLMIKYHATAAPLMFLLPPNDLGGPPPTGRSTASSRVPSASTQGGVGGGRAATSSRGSNGGLKSSLSAYSGANDAPPPPAVNYFLSVNMQVIGYDPRSPKPPRAASLFKGGLPPAKPLFTLPHQLVALSHDLINFDIIPQQCSSKRIVMLRNNSPNGNFEFVFDESSCVLCIQGLLSIKPVFGQIAAGKSVMVELTFKADCNPMIFEEDIKVMVREVLKAGKRQRKTVRHLHRPGTGKGDHESVVCRTTINREIAVGQVLIPEVSGDKHASLPTSVDNGKVVLGKQRFSGTGTLVAEGGEIGDGSYSAINMINNEIDVPGTGSSAKGRVKSATVGFAAERLDTYSSDSFGTHKTREKPIAAKTQPIQKNFSGTSMGRSTSGGDGGGGRLSSAQSRPLTDGDRSVMSEYSGLVTRDSMRTGRTGTGGGTSLLGQSTILIVRLKGEVHGVDTIRTLLDRETATATSANIMSSFVLPSSTPFIQPAPLVFSHQPAPGEGGGGGGSLQSGGSLSKSPSHKSSQGSLINLEFVKGRDIELRGVVTYAMSTILGELLFSPAMADHTSNVVTGGNVQYVPVSGLEKPVTAGDDTSSSSSSSDWLRGAHSEDRLTGKEFPIGVFAQEVLPPKLSLLSRFVIEMKHLGYVSCHETGEPIQLDGIELSDGQDKAAGRAVVVLPRAPAEWASSGDAPLLVDQLDFAVTVQQLLQVLSLFKLTKENNQEVYESIMSRIVNICTACSERSAGMRYNENGEDVAERDANLFMVNINDLLLSVKGRATSFLESLPNPPLTDSAFVWLNVAVEAQARKRRMARLMSHRKKQQKEQQQQQQQQQLSSTTSTYTLAGEDTVSVPVADVVSDGPSSAAAVRGMDVEGEEEKKTSSESVTANSSSEAVVAAIPRNGPTSVCKALFKHVPGFLDAANEALGALMFELVSDAAQQAEEEDLLAAEQAAIAEQEREFAALQMD